MAAHVTSIMKLEFACVPACATMAALATAAEREGACVVRPAHGVQGGVEAREGAAAGPAAASVNALGQCWLLANAGTPRNKAVTRAVLGLSVAAGAAACRHFKALACERAAARSVAASFNAVGRRWLQTDARVPRVKAAIHAVIGWTCTAVLLQGCSLETLNALA